MKIEKQIENRIWRQGQNSPVILKISNKEAHLDVLISQLEEKREEFENFKADEYQPAPGGELGPDDDKIQAFELEIEILEIEIENLES